MTGNDAEQKVQNLSKTALVKMYNLVYNIPVWR